jgi:hypothetical protein
VILKPWDNLLYSDPLESPKNVPCLVTTAPKQQSSSNLPLSINDQNERELFWFARFHYIDKSDPPNIKHPHSMVPVVWKFPSKPRFLGWITSKIPGWTLLNGRYLWIHPAGHPPKVKGYYHPSKNIHSWCIPISLFLSLYIYIYFFLKKYIYINSVTRCKYIYIYRYYMHIYI